jgi:hypothetical protein
MIYASFRPYESVILGHMSIMEAEKLEGHGM